MRRAMVTTGKDTAPDILRIYTGCTRRSGWPGDGGRSKVCYLTPVKERKFFFFQEPGPALYEAAARVVEEYWPSPAGVLTWLSCSLGKTAEDWGGFPAIIRVVDRGDPAVRNSDIGAMELYAASVITSDPFWVAEKIKRIKY